MKRNFILNHWLATLILAPFLPTVYDFFFTPIQGQIVGLLVVYPITFVFSLVLSIPTLIVYYFVFWYLSKRQTNPALTKIILISLTVIGIITTILIIGGSLSMMLIYSFSTSAIITGILIRITNRTERSKQQIPEF
jgi:hypothetical protein